MDKIDLSNFENDEDITLDENIYVSKKGFDINNLQSFKDTDRGSNKMVSSYNPRYDPFLHKVAPGPLESQLPISFSNRNSYNAKTHVKNSLTGTDLGKFSKKRTRKSKKVSRPAEKERQPSRINLNFENNLIFSTMSYKSKKPWDGDLYRQNSTRYRGRISSSSVRKKKAHLRPSKKGEKQRSGFVRKKSKTPKKNVSIRKQIKNLDQLSGTAKDLQMLRKPLNNFVCRQFLKQRRRAEEPKLLLSMRERSTGKKSRKSGLLHKFLKPSSLERSFKLRLSSVDKKLGLAGLGLSKFQLEKKEIKKMIINKNIFGKINHLRRNTSSGYKEVTSKHNFLKNKDRRKAPRAPKRSRGKRLSGSRNPSNTPGYKSFIRKKSSAKPKKKNFKMSQRVISGQRKCFAGDSLEKFRQIRKRSPLAKKLLLKKSRDKGLAGSGDARQKPRKGKQSFRTAKQ